MQLHSNVIVYIFFSVLHKTDRFFKLNFSLGNIITMNKIRDEQRGGGSYSIPFHEMRSNPKATTAKDFNRNSEYFCFNEFAY